MTIFRWLLVLVGVFSLWRFAAEANEPGGAGMAAVNAVTASLAFGGALVLLRTEGRRAANRKPRIDATSYIVMGLAVVIAVIGAVIPLSHQAASVGTAEVALEGTLSGQGFTLDSDATITSDKYGETTLDVRIRRVGDELRMTPDLVASLETPDGTKTMCTMGRTHMWSNDAGSVETLLCDTLLTPEELTVVQVQMAEATYP